MSVNGAVLEALRALQMDLEDAGIEPAQFAAALDRLHDAIEDERAWMRAEIADFKAMREKR